MIRRGAPSPGAGPEVEGYLAEITALLPGRPRAQAGIVAELRSGLLDATDAYRLAGLPPAEASRAAIQEFGDPVQVADCFRAEIAASQARRIAIALLTTGPMVGLLWVTVAMVGHLGIRLGLPWPGTGLPPGLRAVLLLIAVAAGATGWAAVFGIAITSRLTRWLPAKPRRAPTAAAIAGFGAVGADGLALVLLAGQLATGPGKLSPLPVAAVAAAAAVASIVRMVLARRAARHCLAMRATLA